MKKRYGFILVILLFVCISAAAADVQIDATHFPDTNFRAAVSAAYDEDRNGILSNEEIENAEYGDFADKGIFSLQGIEYFTKMR